MKKLKLGLIGAGIRGLELAPNFQHKESKAVFVAASDPSEKGLAAFKKAYSFATTYKNYKDLLKNKEVEAVIVATPDFLHEKHVIAALKAGKHVFCEKPMAITIEACDRIIRERKKSRKKLMIGYNMRHMTIFEEMKKVLDSGVLGHIKAVWVRHFVGIGGHYYFHDWHGVSKYSTGLLLQKGTHDLDMIHYLTGSYAKKVSAFGSLDYFGGNKPNNLRCSACKIKKTCPEFEKPPMDQCCFRKEVDVEDNSTVIMELENGIKATYVQCHFTPEYFRNYVFIGTKGRMENLTDQGPIEVKLRPKFTKGKALRLIKLKSGKGRHFGADAGTAKSFIDYILKNKKPRCTPIDGRMSVAVGVLGTESIRSGGKVLRVPKVAGTRGRP